MSRALQIKWEKVERTGLGETFKARPRVYVWSGRAALELPRAPLSEQMRKLSEGILNEVVGVVPKVWGPREA